MRYPLHSHSPCSFRLTAGRILVAMLGAIVIFAAFARHVTAQAPSLVDIAVVTDDDATTVPGCDDVTIVDTRTGRVIDRSNYRQSPGRIAMTPGAEWIISVCNNGGPFAVLMNRQSLSPLRWTSTNVAPPVLSGGAVAVAPDGSYALIAWTGGINKYTTSNFERASLGTITARFISTSQIAEIEISSDSRRIYALRLDGLIEELNAADMSVVAPPIPYRPITTSRDLQVRLTFSALTATDRYLLVNSGSARVNVIDTRTRTSNLVDVPGMGNVFGISANFAAYDDVIALRGEAAVGVFHVDSASALSLIASTSAPAQRPVTIPQTQDLARHSAIAWTGRGDGVVTAIGGQNEFRVFDFVDRIAGQYSLDRRLDFEACTSSKYYETALDVVTLNDRLPRPTPSPTATTPASLTPPPPATRTPATPPPPTLTPTSSPTPTAQPSPTPTPTPPPSPIYLPLALNEHCTPTQRRTDAVLVIDASTSMLDRDASGAVKLDAAINAARAFIALLDLHDPSAPVDARNPGDQAALIAFNADAQLLQPLTTDPNALASAFARIVPASQTCLVCAVEAAAAELASARHRDGNVPVVVLLTDGRANPRPAGEAVDAAARAKAVGVTFFTIALGDDVDDGALEAIAAPGGRYYRAVTADGLAEVYRQVAGRIPCPAEEFLGRR